MVVKRVKRPHEGQFVELRPVRAQVAHDKRRVRVNHVKAFAPKTQRGERRDATNKGKCDRIIGCLEPVPGGETHHVVGVVFVVGKARREDDHAVSARAQFEGGRMRRSHDAVFRGQISVAEKGDIHGNDNSRQKRELRQSLTEERRVIL